MYKNYFFILRCIRELSPLIQGKEIIEVYTQEKDKLFLHIPTKSNPAFHVIISTNLQQPFISVKDEHHKAKKNTVSFFNDFFPAKVDSVRIALGDRIIKFTLSNSKLYIVFRGGKSNIYLIGTDNNLHSFKKTSADEKSNFLNELSKLQFIDSISPMVSYLTNIGDITSIRKLPFIGKDILREVDFRNGDFLKTLFELLNEIIKNDIAVYFDESSNRPYFYPASFKSFEFATDCVLYKNYFDAINNYFTLSFSHVRVKDIRKEIEKYLESEIEKLSNRLNNLKIRIESGSKEKVYHKYADLLLSNIGSLHKGMKEIVLDDYNSTEQIKILLDEKLTPNKNVEKYYDKSRAEKIEYQKSKELLSSSVNNYERLINMREKLEKADDQQELIQIKKDLKLKTKTSSNVPDKDRMPFKHFVIDGKYHFYVGKDSKNNDLLTTQFAKQNDFWFHVRSFSGSHVVLRVENTKEVIPKRILEKVASVAAFYSKAKASSLVSVTYTLKKYVFKNKRQEPGQVSVTKEKVLLVKPEIPKDCEMVTD